MECDKCCCVTLNIRWGIHKTCGCSQIHVLGMENLRYLYRKTTHVNQYRWADRTCNTFKSYKSKNRTDFLRWELSQWFSFFVRGLRHCFYHSKISGSLLYDRFTDRYWRNQRKNWIKPEQTQRRIKETVCHLNGRQYTVKEWWLLLYTDVVLILITPDTYATVCGIVQLKPSRIRLWRILICPRNKCRLGSIRTLKS